MLSGGQMNIKMQSWRKRMFLSSFQITFINVNSEPNKNSHLILLDISWVTPGLCFSSIFIKCCPSRKRQNKREKQRPYIWGTSGNRHVCCSQWTGYCAFILDIGDVTIASRLITNDLSTTVWQSDAVRSGSHLAVPALRMGVIIVRRGILNNAGRSCKIAGLCVLHQKWMN